METKANYVIIGAFTLAVAVAAVLFGLFAARFATDQAWTRYEILFDESVFGLSEGSPVLYNGVSVGRVIDIDLNPEDVRQVLVTVEIDANVPIHTDTRATVRLTGLTGTAAIQLSGGSPEAPLLAAEGRDLARIEAGSSALSRLLEESEGIAVTANDLLNRAGRLLDDENIARVDGTLASVESFAAQLAETDGALNRLLANGAEVSETLPDLVTRLEAAAVRFTETVDRFDRTLVAELPELRERFDRTLANLESLSGRVDSIVASNQEALGRIGEVGLREVDGSLRDLRTLIRELSTLVRRIEQDPARFLVGGEQPEEYRGR
jgi:phospholipid/cholesterol/gamma-HCH transport system substrate-binding protein